MTDPYRSSGGEACPQCSTPLERSPESIVPGVAPCPNACGAWLPTTYLASLFDTSEIAREAHDAEQAEVRRYELPPCPTCSAPLVRAWLGAAPIRMCAEHGLWVAATSAGRFDAQLAGPVARHRRLLELMALLSHPDDASRREVAKRVLALEDRVAAIEAALRDHR